MDPADTRSLSDLLANAFRAIAAQKLTTAEQTLKQAVAIAPDSAEAQRLSGVVQLMRGNAGTAVGFLRRAVELNPGDFNAHMNLGSALFQCQYPDAAFVSMRRACELAPETGSPWYNLGRALYIARHTEEARPALERAMSLDPSHVMTQMTLGNVLSSLGDIGKAAKLYRNVLQNHPNYANAWYSLVNLKTVKLDGAEVQHIKQLLEHPDLSANDRVWLGFALAKSLESQNDLAASFHTLQIANATKRRFTSWDIATEHRRIDSFIEAFTPPLPPAVDPNLGNEVIFIACLPRSGSTLAEHILASHSQVEGANEIPDLTAVLRGESERRQQTLRQWAPLAMAEDWHRLGCEYMERTARWRKHKPRFTDKNLGNWALVGPALTMLPGARVVNTRRDPLETCFACYRELFSVGAEFSYDLESVAHYYAGYDRISQFWRQRFPGRCLDHVYEDLLADPEGSIRKLLAFCDLPFEPACLEPHKTSRVVYSNRQVRQPLQSDTARSARYGTLLDPLRDLLRQLGISDHAYTQ
jgi:tetratricopeptide (TPR) repeat protein